MNRNNRNKRSNKKKLAKADEKLLTNRQFREPWNLTMPRGMIGFPERLGITLKYSETTSFSASPAPAAQTYRMNSLFDPNLTGVGHQPSYFDNLAAIYGRYIVLGYSVKAEINNHTTTAGLYVVGCYSDIDISANSVEQITEAKLSKTTVVGLAGGMATKT